MPVEPPPTPWHFPDPTAVVDDLIGLGADLEPGTLLAAYRHGMFPMPLDEELGWFSPMQRGVLPLYGLRVSRSLKRAVRGFEIRVNTAFLDVVDGCADPTRDGSWIDDDIRSAYHQLHQLGWAHSVETWRDDELVGGLYGVGIGGLFAGESMFHRARDASKVALVGLVELLSDKHSVQRLLDVQWQTPHLATLGVIEIDRRTYLSRLERALALPLPEPFAG